MSRSQHSRAEQLAAEIERDILDARPQPGERLGFRTELIERYGVSPSVMNEALQILRERGRVLVKRGVTGGIFVNDVPPQLRIGVVDIWFDGLADARDMFEARRSLEDLLSETALHRATPEDVQMMAWALDELHGSREDPKLFFVAILRFHIAVARAARIPYISDLYATLSTLLANTIVKARFIDDHERPANESVVVHGRLLEAIKAKDADALRRACRVHNEMELRETHLPPGKPDDEQPQLAAHEAG
ncbi:GntR family transcriptional repressor for pyruvate dehydrogenase complex [Nocardia kruczakiae]|uniref:GntR family transcriptional repressor for pyruvate dehydrogenase complex n=1 Tax=Nocardia kruczakiae TaxID=261477 RepID=A0ABU1XR64_9NOCA|nr:FCD domain-containing protein [Nocardia kruczakiae]MDR7173050.1 GntR family transcriptional repressor for pyruvate dehydrogenase complex [Nocardia kruczakiae]